MNKEETLEGKHRERMRVFHIEDFELGTSTKKWNLFKIVCFQEVRYSCFVQRNNFGLPHSCFENQGFNQCKQSKEEISKANNKTKELTQTIGQKTQNKRKIKKKFSKDVSFGLSLLRINPASSSKGLSPTKSGTEPKMVH